jgi:hypothetical protein
VLGVGIAMRIERDSCSLDFSFVGIVVVLRG